MPPSLFPYENKRLLEVEAMHAYVIANRATTRWPLEKCAALPCELGLLAKLMQRENISRTRMKSQVKVKLLFNGLWAHCLRLADVLNINAALYNHAKGKRDSATGATWVATQRQVIISATDSKCIGGKFDVCVRKTLCMRENFPVIVRCLQLSHKLAEAEILKSIQFLLLCFRVLSTAHHLNWIFFSSGNGAVRNKKKKQRYADKVA